MVKGIFTLILSFCLCLGTIAQIDHNLDAHTNVNGTLRNIDNDKIIPFAKVVLEQDDIIVHSTLTDSEGKYCFLHVKQGAYNVKATVYNYELVYLSSIQVHQDREQRIDLDFDLGRICTLGVIHVLALPPMKITRATSCFAGSSSITTMPDHPTTLVYDEEAVEPPHLVTRNKPNPQAKDPDKPIKELNIYPNPSFGPIQIELTFETLQIRLFDMLGHNLGEVKYQTVSDEKVGIDLSFLPAGTYALQLQHEEGTEVQKVIIIGK